jgi:hypothetical protein
VRSEGVTRTVVIVEVGEEGIEFLFVFREDLGDWWGFVGIGDKDFENMEGFELNTLALILEKHHHQLQIGRITYVLRHDVEVGTIQQQFTQKLEVKEAEE